MSAERNSMAAGEPGAARAEAPGTHDHAPSSFGRAFAIGIAMNVIYVLAEAGVGLRIGSVGLVADAGHNASDVLSLVVAWVAARMAARPPSVRFTYGLRRSTVLASLFNALLLFGAMGVVAWEAVGRLGRAAPVEGGTIAWVASIGLVVNFGTAALFLRGRSDLNIRGAYLHMLADGLVTLGVLVAGLLIHFTGLTWLDPAIGIAIVGVVLWTTWGLFRDAMRLSLDAVPAHIDLRAVRDWLAALPGVVDVHDLHVWPISTTETALTVHLVVSDFDPHTSTLLEQARRGLHDAFQVGHSTIQIESPAVAAAEAETRCPEPGS